MHMLAAAQPGLAKDSMIPRTLLRDMHQMMSVYCDVTTGGLIRIGDLFAVQS